MPRVKAIKTKNSKPNSKNDINTLVFLMKDNTFGSTESSNDCIKASIIKLRHPCTDQSSLFLFSSNNTIQEILTFSNNKKSWFIDEFVVNDGKLRISTYVDPIFLILPYLVKHCSRQAVPLDHILTDDNYPEISKVLEVVELKYLNSIADQKGDEELKAFKYNEEKTLLWLQKKVKCVANALKQNNIHVSSGSTSTTFVKSHKDEQLMSAYLKCAHGVVSDYLTEDLSSKLLKYLNLSDDDEVKNQTNKRKNSTHTESNNKKIKTNKIETNTKEPELEIPKLESKIKQTPASSKEKARAKAATGSKSINSFFKKI